MRSPIGPFLVITTLATTVALVLLLFVTLGTRSELESVRGELDALRTEVAEDGAVTDQELGDRLDELEAAIGDLIVTSGGGSPTGVPAADGDVADQIEEILDRLVALDDRVDEICGNVPVC